MNNKHLLIVATLCCLGTAPSGQAQAASASGIDTLFKQAEFWQGKNRPDLARQALQRILAADPDNREALYRMALYDIQEGNNVQAQSRIAHLQQLAPNDLRLRELEQTQRLQSMDTTGLAQARRLAQEGNYAAAVARYTKLFEGNAPPPDLAGEYYLTLAGTDDGWGMARQGLERLQQQHPDDTRLTLALGQLLSYREPTRRQGIKLLSRLAADNPGAVTDWRQALLWLDAKADDRPLYADYVQANPDDAQVIAHFRDKTTVSTATVADQARAAGYAALKANRLNDAEQAFRQALTLNPDDAEALAGRGLVELRTQRFDSASNTLAQAIEKAPDQRDQWAEAYASARFYSALTQVRHNVAAGRLDQALTEVRPLTQGKNARARSAQLLEADILQRQGKFKNAEQHYRAILDSDANSTEARIGLINVLQQQQRWQEAAQLAQQLPDNLRQRAGDPDQLQAQALREQAGNEDIITAEVTLRHAMQLSPQDPWVRLDLARLLDRQGDADQAQALMEALADTVTGRYAAALLASEQSRWQDAQRLLETIPAGKRSAGMLALAERANNEARLQEVRQKISAGDTQSARRTLQDLYAHPPGSSAAVGEVASALADVGEPGMALSLVRRDIATGLDASPGAYANHARVLAQSGHQNEVDMLVERLAQRNDLSAVEHAEVADLKNGVAVTKADRLRNEGYLASAYDLLARRMHETPDDEQLLLAMARLYQSGNENDQAYKIYAYTLQRHTKSTQALQGALETSLDSGDTEQAAALLKRHNTQDDATLLMLSARVAQAQGDTEQAVNLLRRARRHAYAEQGGEAMLLANSEAPLLIGNPFRDAPSSAGSALDDNSARPRWLPGSSDATPQDTTTSHAGTSATDTGASPLIASINAMLDDISRQRATHVEGGLDVRLRDGESGLSELSTVSSPLTISGAPFGNSRLEATVTPVYLNAGTATGDATRRLGRGALVDGAAALSEATNIDASEANALSNRLAAYTSDAKDRGAQTASGVGLSVAYKGDQLDADVGSTPLGFQEAHAVGGVEWHPQISAHTQLSLKAERRAVTDSALAYAGTKDPANGDEWGGVVKTGGEVQLAYDNGDVGMYGGIGAHRYTGHNVASNTSVETSLGAYLRPINEQNRKLQTGVNVSYMSYDKNLSHFSYGQGGYFSPQDYVSVSFPVSYSATHDKLAYTAHVAPGFQSYSEDASDYFPTDSNAQDLLDQLAADGLVSESRYSANSESGLGINLGASADYHVNRDVLVGGRVGYNSFGDYNESSAMLYIKYLMGNAGD